MNEHAYFIQDRAQALSYEAVHFPATAPAALAWIHRAVAWAKARRLTDLSKTLSARLEEIGARMQEAS